MLCLMDNYWFLYLNSLNAHLLHTQSNCTLNTPCYKAISHKQNDIFLQFLHHFNVRTPHFARARTHTHTHFCNLEDTRSTFSLRSQEGQQLEYFKYVIPVYQASLFSSANFISPTPTKTNHI